MRDSRRCFLRSLGASAATIPCSWWSRLALAQTAAGERQAVEPANTGPLVAEVRDLGLQFLDNPLNITGQDGATSCRLPDGSALWLFGDTIEGKIESIRNHDLTEVLSNTAAIIEAQDVSAGIKRFEHLRVADKQRPRQVIRFGPNEDKSRHRLWPIHSICVGEFVYAFYHKITMDPEVDVFETFELNGMGIARARIGEYQFERLTAPDGSKEFWKGDVPTFGVFVEQLADGYVYLWGCYWTGMFLARTRAASIADLTSYEYLVEAPTSVNPRASVRWDKQFQPTAPLFDGVPNELSVSYNPYLKKHVAVHVFHRENMLALRTAPAITGPWSAEEIFFQPKRISEEDLYTAGKEHPELRQLGGRVMYVTYVNSSVYVPHLLEVKLR